MSLENIYYIGQTIAVVAILGSLIALWFQGRQTNKIARVDMTERIVGRYFSAMETMVQDEKLALHYARLIQGQSPYDDAVEARLTWFFSLLMQAHASSFLAWRERLTDKMTISRHDNTVLLHLKVPLFREEWERTKRRGTFPDEYIAHVEKLQSTLTKAAAPANRVEALVVDDKPRA